MNRLNTFGQYQRILDLPIILRQQIKTIFEEEPSAFLVGDIADFLAAMTNDVPEEITFQIAEVNETINELPLKKLDFGGIMIAIVINENEMIKAKCVGEDDWSRKLYKGTNGKIYVNVDGVLYSMTREGEPLAPVKNVEIEA